MADRVARPALQILTPPGLGSAPSGGLEQRRGHPLQHGHCRGAQDLRAPEGPDLLSDFPIFWCGVFGSAILDRSVLGATQIRPLGYNCFTATVSTYKNGLKIRTAYIRNPKYFLLFRI